MQYKNLEIKENYSLRELTTMKIGGEAIYFADVKSIEELKNSFEFADKNDYPVFVFSGGSNILFSDNGFNGLVVRIGIKGVKIETEDDIGVRIKVGAGEIWDSLVARAVDNDWWGIENMSGIPGRMGGFVAQNAGAYGQECSQVMENVEVYNIEKKKFEIFNKEECGFSYRTSVFGGQLADKYVIVNVVLKLKKQARAQVDYPDVKKYFSDKKIEKPSINQIREAIIQIRSNKLPNWGKFGSAGSFFRNLELSEEGYSILIANIRKNFAEQVASKLEDIKNKFLERTSVKIPTAFLIDICGLKGERVGGAKVHEKQPLVLMNESGEASAADIMNLFRKVRKVVFRKTGMKLKLETRLVGFSKQELAEYFELK